MRKLLFALARKLPILVFALILVCLMLAPPAGAQGALPPYWVRAAEFNQWSFNSQQANTYTFSGTNCFVSPQTNGPVPQFFAFGPNSAPYPVYIQDANPSNSEIVTPSSVSMVSSACGFSAATANQHTSFVVKSGTAGLQEAVGTIGNSATPAYPWNVIVDRTTYTQVSGLPSGSVASIIGALKGSVNVQIVDTTTAPWTFYVWNGSNYVPRGGANTPPTLAVTGAGAGTSPSATSITGSATAGTVAFTTGTTPGASDAVFTLTYPTVANGGPGYAIACTFTSIGTNAYKTGTSSTTGTPEVVTFTASSTALAGSTAYVFNYHCN
jgi:hypothetical protein